MTDFSHSHSHNTGTGFLLSSPIIRMFLPFFILFVFCAVTLLPAQGISLLPKNKKEIEKDAESAKMERQRISSSFIYSKTQTRYAYKFGKIEPKGITESITRYNNSGYIIEESNFNNIDGSLQTRKAYRYDNRGNIIEETVTTNENITKTVNRYNTLNKLSESILYKNDGSIDKKITYLYDNNGLLLETIGYLQDGRLFLRESFLYDHTGNVAERKNSQNKFVYGYSNSGNIRTLLKYTRVFHLSDSTSYQLTDRYEFTFDKKDNLVSMSNFRPDSTVKARYEYTVDPNGLLTSEKEFSGDNALVYQRRIIYDAANNVTEESGFDHSYYFKTTYKYDSRGNLIETVEYDQIKEPKYLLKITYGRSTPNKEPKNPETAPSIESIPPVDAGIFETDPIEDEKYEPYIGGRLVAPDGAYLGIINADSTDSQSIINSWGQYGFQESPTSIFNPTIAYGGKDGVFSPFNPTSPSPPSIYKDGKFFSYCTENENFRPRISPKKLITYLRMVSQKNH